MATPNILHHPTLQYWWHSLEQSLRRVVSFDVAPHETIHWHTGYARAIALHASTDPPHRMTWLHWLLGQYLQEAFQTDVNAFPQHASFSASLPDIATWLPNLLAPKEDTTLAQAQWQSCLMRWCGFSQTPSTFLIPSYNAIQQGLKLSLRLSLSCGFSAWGMGILQERHSFQKRHPEYVLLLVRTLLLMLQEAMIHHWHQRGTLHSHPYAVLPEPLYHFYQGWIPLLLQEITMLQPQNPSVAGVWCQWYRLCHLLHTPQEAYTPTPWESWSRHRLVSYPLHFTLEALSHWQDITPKHPIYINEAS